MEPNVNVKPRSQSRVLALLATLAMAAPWGLLACGDDEGATGLLEECEKDDDCKSGHCIENINRTLSVEGFGMTTTFSFCSKSCDDTCTGADDQPGVCGFSSEGDGWCVEPCQLGQKADVNSKGYDCRDKVPISCEAKGVDCMLCGCGDAEYCNLTNHRCEPKSVVDMGCAAHDMCATNHCNFSTDQCEAELGGSCDEATCSDCSTVAGESYCTQSCTDNRGCPVGWSCVSFFTETETFCRKNCTGLSDSCPSSNEECMELAEGGAIVCAG